MDFLPRSVLRYGQRRKNPSAPGTGAKCVPHGKRDLPNGRKGPTVGTVPLHTTKQPKTHGQQGQPASTVMASVAPRSKP